MNHQFFGSKARVSQSLCNDRCQTVLYKAVFEHFTEVDSIAALLLASKSFQNSSFGANFVVNYIVDKYTIGSFDNVLSPSSCQSLQFIPSLKIEHTGSDAETVGQNVIQHFVAKLVKTKYLHLQLQYLSLHVTEKVAVSSWFFDGSMMWPRLQSLILEKNDVMDDDQVALICTAASHLNSLRISCCAFVTDESLKRISHLSRITHLDVSGCRKISDAGMEHISNLSGITSLNVCSCRMITDIGVDHVSKLSGITYLDLCGCDKITDGGLESVARLSAITELNLCFCTQITDAGVEHLSALVDITSLNLSFCNKLTDAGLGHISRLSNITCLNVACCKKFSDAGIQHLCKLSRLCNIDVSHCSVDVAPLEAAFPNAFIEKAELED